MHSKETNGKYTQILTGLRIVDLWLIITYAKNQKKDITLYKMGMYYFYSQR